MRYTRVSVKILDRLAGVPTEAKAVYFGLLVGPHRSSAPGLFRAGPAALAEACETTPDVFAANVAVLAERGLVVADFSVRVVFLPHSVEDDPPANRNVVRAWRKVLDEIPACEVKAAAVETLRRAAGKFALDEDGSDLLADTVSDTVPDTVSDTVPEPFGNGMTTQTPTPIQIQTPRPREGAPRPLRTPAFSSPSDEDVRAFVEEERLGDFNARVFVSHYSKKGWLVGRSPMTDWKAAVRNAAFEGWTTLKAKPDPPSPAEKKRREEEQERLEARLRERDRVENERFRAEQAERIKAGMLRV